MNQISAIFRMFYEPSAAFRDLKEKPAAWLVLVMTIVLTIGVFVWYYTTVDFPWLVERFISAQPDMKPEVRESMPTFMNRNTMMYSTLIWVLIATPVFYALHGLYFLIASRITDGGLNFKRSFHLAIWASVPALLGIPLMALQVATGHGQVGMEDLNMLSLNYLVTHLPMGDKWTSFFNSLSVLHFWSIFVAASGIKVWTEKSIATSLTIAALPYAVIYGLWAAKNAFF
ncbi:YIP1 family protein [Undibacterium cyanobacteriorum]|uniref:YIP1 family protein n=1 Tax=Undibacterium cyanobacteriorum TaxID=3073561 RepID=A0ABY9RJ83_9BURK|nr:YIP1 family protein [Undibacterium sp. 20NA77.5]WMW81284.1 YIP1 family protein [Undibacterium sp. 20NA77.5]